VTEKLSGPSKRGGARPGAGRKKGIPNKIHGEVKSMILEALEKAGGVDYLADRAKDTPTAFMALLGRVLPMQMTGEDGGPVKTVTRIEIVGVPPK
jgi:hypothetical protein